MKSLLIGAIAAAAILTVPLTAKDLPSRPIAVQEARAGGDADEVMIKTNSHRLPEVVVEFVINHRSVLRIISMLMH